MNFIIDTATVLDITDAEITELLTQVYVEAGFTSQQTAVTIFEPSAVRQRGIMFGAREKNSSALAGMVIVVPPGAPAQRLTRGFTSEMQLLGVKDEYRKMGLGSMLVSYALDKARSEGYLRMALWTQTTMHPAHKLYESHGFIHVDDIVRNDGRKFKVYERAL